MFHPVERRNITVSQQGSCSELLPGIVKQKTFLCWTAEESLHCFSYAFSGAEGPQPFHSKMKRTACMGMCGGISVGCRDCATWCDHEPAACRKIRFAS